LQTGQGCHRPQSEKSEQPTKTSTPEKKPCSCRNSRQISQRNGDAPLPQNLDYIADDLDDWTQFFDLQEDNLGILIHPQYSDTDPENGDQLPAEQHYWETGIHARSLEEIQRYGDSRIRYDTYLTSNGQLTEDQFYNSVYKHTVDSLKTQFPEAEIQYWERE
jgi:hypothetical protein